MLNLSSLPPKSPNQLILNVKKSVLIVFVLMFCLSCSLTKKTKISQNDIFIVSTYMQEQENYWNEGDLDGFMKHYWKSDSLRFIGKNGLNYGWQKTLDNYKKSYKNREEMGTLTFKNKSLDFIGEQTIFVIGEWSLKRADTLGDLRGMYSLIWEQKNGKWVITTDHSS
jgi:ketosteroid isomerase-like protein